MDDNGCELIPRPTEGKIEVTIQPDSGTCRNWNRLLHGMEKTSWNFHFAGQDPRGKCTTDHISEGRTIMVALSARTTWKIFQEMKAPMLMGAVNRIPTVRLTAAIWNQLTGEYGSHLRFRRVTKASTRTRQRPWSSIVVAAAAKDRRVPVIEQYRHGTALPLNVGLR